MYTNLVGLKYFLDKFVLGWLHQLDKIDKQDVLVLLHKIVDVIRHQTRVMIDNKPLKLESNIDKTIIILSAYPAPASLKCSCLEKDPASFALSCWSDPAFTACIVAQTSSMTEKIPGGFFPAKIKQSLETIGLLCQICQLTLDKFAHRYVIEIFDFLPLNSFLDVLFLLCL